MNRFLSTLASAFLALPVSSQALAADPTITTYTASPAGFAVSSHLIQGERDAILVDAQFTLSEAAKVVEMVRGSGKQLKYIVVTHGHPDHFFGLGVLQQAFPDARIVAAQPVIADIQDYGPRAIVRWKPVFKEEIPDSFLTPAPVNATSLFIEGNEIQLLTMDGGESPHATVLWIPSTKALLTGDLTYNNVHLWLRENRPEGWLEILDRFERLHPVSVYPGHGAAGGPELIDANRAYIHAFVAATAPPATKEEAAAKLKAQFADDALPVIVDFSVAGRLGN
jgi:glyoxylase-like metal-dependent hydrolase (beta-lactamase superfamily II)